MNKAYLFPLVTIGILAFCEPEAYAADYVPLGDPNCGQLGQRACLFGDLEWGVADLKLGKAGCDRGLEEQWSLSDARAYCVNHTRESIPVDNWPAKALRLQRELQADLQFHRMTVLNTHNAFNSSNDGYSVPNQTYSITDQLRMGVRSLSLDVHWVLGPGVTPPPNALRLCHSTAIGTLPYSAHAIGCSAFDRPFHQIIEELAHWMRRPENSNEVVFLDMELYTDGHDADLKTVMETVLGDLWLRKDDFNALKKPDGTTKADGTLGTTWPSLTQIRATGKRLVAFINSGPLENKGPDWANPVPAGYAKNFVAATCSFVGAEPMYPKILEDKVHYGVTEDSTRIVFGLAYDGPTEVGVIMPETLQQLTACNVTNISLDQITLDKIQNAVWSWGTSQPDNSNNEDCVEMTANGRWNDLRCDENRPYACYSESAKAWAITSATTAGPWAGGSIACKALGSGYAYSVPRDGYQNKVLHNVNGRPSQVWLNLNDVNVEGSWTDSTLVNWALNMPTSQSSTYAHSIQGGSEDAVDGNTDGRHINGSVTHTNEENQPWWKVDLQGLQNIESVVLFNRTDCCGERLKDFKVLVSDDGATWHPYPHLGEVKGKVTVSINRTARYVKVQLNGTGVLSLAEVQVLGKNLALNMPASQSSTYTHNSWNEAKNAVDGNTDGNYLNKSVTHTNEENQPWWRVDLLESQYIRTVRLFNRTDCCGERLSNFKVLVSEDNATWHEYPHPGTVIGTADIPINRTARYVKVQLNGIGVLNLAEVQVLP